MRSHHEANKVLHSSSSRQRLHPSLNVDVNSHHHSRNTCHQIHLHVLSGVHVKPAAATRAPRALMAHTLYLRHSPLLLRFQQLFRSSTVLASSWNGRVDVRTTTSAPGWSAALFLRQVVSDHDVGPGRPSLTLDYMPRRAQVGWFYQTWATRLPCIGGHCSDIRIRLRSGPRARPRPGSAAQEEGASLAGWLGGGTCPAGVSPGLKRHSAKSAPLVPVLQMTRLSVWPRIQPSRR